MPIGRYTALVACLCVAAPAATQSGLAAPAHASVSAPARAPEVVVNGVIDRKRGSWKRAESDHVIVIGQNSAGELTRVDRNLERLYYLMSRLYRHGDTSDRTVKLQVILFESPTSFRAMALQNLRAQPGPYLPAFSDPTYYDPREDGAVLAVARDEQIVDLNTIRAFNLDCEDYLAKGGMEFCANNVPWHGPAVLTWEQRLYARFAQHFILTYDPGAYPRWYLDGIGALFSTIDVGGNGAIDYGRPPAQYRQVFHSFGNLDVARILTGRYLDLASDKVNWTPYHAWLLAHFFLFSSLKPNRSMQFRHYMADVRKGVPMYEAARIFGDMGKLQRDVVIYGQSDTTYAHAAPPLPATIQDATITTLPPGATAWLEAKLQLGASPAALPGKSGAGTSAAPPDAPGLALARSALEFRPDADTILLAAEAECRSGHPDACLSDAERVLARSPDDVRALAWKGVALTDQAISAPVVIRAQTLALARRTIEQAIALDGEAPLPLIAYFQSFTKAGERVPERAMLGMTEVIRRVPAAPAPRLYLGEELARQGNGELARRVLHTVLYGPYDSPEKQAAAAMFASAGAPSAGH
jgi:hypothetical protein